MSTGYSQKTSKDNYTGQFTDDNSWVGGTAPTLSLGTDNEDVTINGYISYGNPPGPNEASSFPMKNNSNSYDLIINDTLVIYGNLYQPNSPMNIIINSGGLLIIFGNFTVTGSLTVNGNLVVGGTNIGISGSNKASFSGTGNVYAYNYNTGFIPSGQDKSIEPDLQNDDLYVYEFLVGGGASPLPVEVIYFRAIEMKSATKLEWATSFEEDFDYFTLERSSDGKIFKDHVKIYSSTNPTSPTKKYEYIDEMPFRGLSYYRLKATDLNGSFEYHGVVSANLEETDPDILIYSNPNVVDHITISYNGEQESPFRIMNITGKMIEEGKLIPGLNEIIISPSIQTSIYFIQVDRPNSSIVKKFVLR